MLRALDLALLRLLRTRLHGPQIERAVLVFTRTGEHGALWLAVCLVGAIVDGRRRPLYREAALTIVAAYLLNIVLKNVFRRRRPLIEELPSLSTTVTALSYPSAHATTSFAAARVLSGALPSRPLYACAIAMSLSRPYAGVHYPSDIAAGALLGTGVADLLAP
ncbi:MAG: phosphatase PAP2 family protein [Actinomycetota bacterium]